MEPLNIKKLAQLLDLSISTVSKALRDSHDIGKETKERVLKLARELNYQPNPYASSLRKAKSKTIAVVIPEIANNFFTLAINGIESVAQEKGYHVLIYLTHESYEKELALIKHLHSGRVDGLLISLSSTTTDYAHLRELQDRGIPIVFFDRVLDHFNTASITSDDFDSGCRATEHLIAQGCTRIAHLMTSRHLSIGEKRLAGYIKALEKNHLPVAESLIVTCRNDDEQDYKEIAAMIREQKPDGIFAAIERYALITYEVCRDLRIRIPNDVKVIIFSNLKAAALLDPSLTTISQPAFEIGKEAASILFKALDKKRFVLKQEHIILKSDFIARASTQK